MLQALGKMTNANDPNRGIVRGVAVARGDTVFEGHALVFLEEADVSVTAQAWRLAWPRP